jgi:hypothetical protein
MAASIIASALPAGLTLVTSSFTGTGSDTKVYTFTAVYQSVSSARNGVSVPTITFVYYDPTNTNVMSAYPVGPPLISTTSLPTISMTSAANTGGTSTAATVSSTSVPLTEVAPPGVPAAGVAGAVIGGLIAGLALGVLIAWLLFRRRQRDADRSQQNGYAAPVVVESKAYQQPPPPTQADSLQLNQFLLDATPDEDIVSELRSLGQLIHQHVENNYHLQTSQASLTALAQALVNLGLSSGGSLSPEAIATLALNTQTRHIALQHVISQVVFTSIDFSSRSRLSMLPAPIAAFLQSVPPVEHGSGSAEGAHQMNYDFQISMLTRPSNISGSLPLAQPIRLPAPPYP